MSILTRNHVKVLGTGQPMLFAHGFGCDQHMWRYIYPHFQDRYQIILFDYVGSGHSDLTAYNLERYASLSGYAQDVLDICAALSLEHIIFVGHSVSGMIGVLASLKQPGLFDHLIMVGPSPCYIDQPGYEGGFSEQDIDELLETMSANFMGWATQMAPAIMGRPDEAAYGDELTQSFCSTDPLIAHQFAQVTFRSDNRAELPQVSVPSLILQCQADIIAPLAVGQFLNQQLPGSTLRVMQARGHCPHLSSPQETRELIDAYLRASLS
ncbi:alpha/beta fold hydrolase [Spirosoma pulveris]